MLQPQCVSITAESSPPLTIFQTSFLLVTEKRSLLVNGLGQRIGVDSLHSKRHLRVCSKDVLVASHLHDDIASSFIDVVNDYFVWIVVLQETYFSFSIKIISTVCKQSITLNYQNQSDIFHFFSAQIRGKPHQNYLQIIPSPELQVDFCVFICDLRLLRGFPLLLAGSHTLLAVQSTRGSFCDGVILSCDRVILCCDGICFSRCSSVDFLYFL